MRRLLAVTAVLALLCVGVCACADVFDMGSGLTSLKTVPVGDLGNDPEPRENPLAHHPEVTGVVDHGYEIGKYEVTAAQYCDFLKCKAKSDPYGLWNPLMADAPGCSIQRSGADNAYTYSVAGDWANRPVNFVDFWDACRFANWLTNGQGDGDTEAGSYALGGYTGNNGRSIQRSADARWAIPTQDEWYKAAYYKGGGTSAGYWTYATQSDQIPSNAVVDPDPGNNACFLADDTYSVGAPYLRTEVGEFENSESAYGTYDQSGGVWEWNETVLGNNELLAYRGMRGGSYEGSGGGISATSGGTRPPSLGAPYLGFRVVLVPEPPTILALAVGFLPLIGLRRRRR